MDLDQDRKLEDEKDDNSTASDSNDSFEHCQSDYEKSSTLELKTVVSTEKFTDVYLGDTQKSERIAINKRKQQKTLCRSACRWSIVTCILVGAITIAVLIGGKLNLYIFSKFDHIKLFLVGIIEVGRHTSYDKILPKILSLNDVM